MEFLFQTIHQNYQCEIKEKGSRFIAFLFPIKNELEFKRQLDKLKLDYHDASHHCYAFRVDPEGHLARSSDDGEPSGTAGKPIMNQLLSAELSHCGLVVVRYFGGIKLGTGGLVKAYKEVAKQVVAMAQIHTDERTAEYEIDCTFDLSGEILKLLKIHRCEILKKSGSEKLEILMRIPLKEITALEEKTGRMKNVKITPLRQ